MSVFIFSNLISGVTGLDKSVINTANLLADAGHDVHVLNCVGKHGGFSSIEPKFALSPAAHLHSLQAMTVNGGSQLHTKFNLSFSIVQPRLKASFTEHDLLVIREINRQLSASDLVLFTHPLQAVLYMRAIRGDHRRALTMLQIHGNYAEEDHNRELLIEGLPCIDRIQIIAESMRPGIREITSFPDERIQYIPNVHFSIDIGRQSPSTFTAAVIGSLQNRKNQIDAVRAAMRVPSVRLDIWGGAGNDYGKFIESYVANLNLADRIKMRGLGTEQQIYESTNLVLMTSKSEGFPYILMEAASHGIPAIAYDFEFGARDFIEDGVNGFLVPLGDVDLLAKRLEECSKSPDLVAQLGQASHQKFHTQFSPGYVLSQYETIISNDAPSKGPAFSQSFMRDGRQPFDPSSISVTRRKAFGFHYGTEISFTTTPGEYVDLYTMRSKGEPKKLKSTVVGKTVTAFVPKFSNLLNLSRNHLLVAAKAQDSTFSYLLNTSKAGNPERLSEYSRCSQRDSTWSEQNVFVSNKGPHLRYHSYEPLRSVTDETGQPIKFKTVHLNRNGEHAPYIQYYGEFSNLTLRYSSGKTFNFTPPKVTYKELFSRLLEIEKHYSLLQFEVGGRFPWELIRASVIEYLAMAHGLWDAHFDNVDPPNESYFGTKKISEAPSADRLLFEFQRKGDLDHRTYPLRNGNEVIIEYPQSFGYTVDSYIEGPVYPAHEFALTEGSPLTNGESYKPDLLERIFAQEFGVDIPFKNIIDGRLRKFKKEERFWTEIFDKVQFKEVIIPSAYWSAGICQAAKTHGVLVSDVQYALITDLHPTNNFTGKAAYTPDNLYAWSNYWVGAAPKYPKTTLFSRKLSNTKTIEETFDVCVISQPRVTRRIANFLIDLASRFPNRRIAYCLHPAESIEQATRDPNIAGLPNVQILQGDTLDIIANSEICIGGYSTSLYEAAYLGKPTYVIPVPGWEVVEQGISEGFFRIVNDPSELVTFVQPESAKSLF